MNEKISVFIICAKAIVYLLLYNLHGCTFKCCLARKDLALPRNAKFSIFASMSRSSYTYVLFMRSIYS